MYHPRQEMAPLSQVPQIKNGKPNFSPKFQKVELRNSTFFQLFNLNPFCVDIPRYNKPKTSGI